MGLQVIDANDLSNDKKFQRLRELIEGDEDISYI